MKKIIVVEDDRDIAFITTHLLKSLSYDIKLDTTGRDVIKWSEEWRPDLILLDIRLPYKGGVELCKEIKQKQEVVILLFSANVVPEKVVQECHADGFISKPFDFAELEKILEEKLS